MIHHREREYLHHYKRQYPERGSTCTLMKEADDLKSGEATSPVDRSVDASPFVNRQFSHPVRLLAFADRRGVHWSVDRGSSVHQKFCYCSHARLQTHPLLPVLAVQSFAVQPIFSARHSLAQGRLSVPQWSP